MNSFSRGLFVVLFLAFIAATIIGTLSHELGHYFAAKYFGYNAKINYTYTYWMPNNPNSIINSENSFYITLAGPLQTMLTGTIGLVLLFIFRNSFFATVRLAFGQWILIFISLFWLRQTANLFTWIGGYIIAGQFSFSSDEIRIAEYFQLPYWVILTLTAIIGTMVLIVVIFKFIPAAQRLTFIVSGLSGGIVGYVLWIVLLGKYIIP